MVYKKKIGYALVMFGSLNNHALSVWDLILPRFCCSCKSKLKTLEKSLCNICFARINEIDDLRLQIEFDRKFADKKIISDLFSPFLFEKDKELQHAIHSLKYENKFRTGLFFGEIIANKISTRRPNWLFDIIIPIPLHKLKETERGYNQSYYIAKGINKSAGIKVSKTAVKRSKYTESQTALNIIEREENIHGAFKVTNKKKVSDKSILIIDDVITTGATISECGRVLLEAGAKKLFAASIALAG